jgi:hypothetical protein
MKRLLILSVVLMLGHLCNAQKVDSEKLIVAYYNVDNMFDINDDDGSYDDDFLPGGNKFWGEQRYNSKLDKIAEVIGLINGKDLPQIIVISEIENKKVVNDLLQRKVFRKHKYKIYFNSNKDGKSTAILGSSESIRDIESRPLEINNLNPEKTASIFYTSFSMQDGNTYHLFINNWADRSGGLSGSEPSRMNCAVSVRREIDNILNFERDARIIVMGTFYDEPTNKSILTMLNASNKKKNINYRDLYNPFYDAHNQNESGTVVVNKSLQMYDFIIVSPRLLRENGGFSSGFSPGEIFTNSSSEPLPTFRGDEYINGASSHFPVFIRLSRSTRQ